ncbi:zinc-regulated TonB-dependent outer membrane receptor [Candidatus Poribacteria bacterium]|nr:zinc-regulated TonB-dependent outer membrane receptor [Candidatus Poribacteria bacterium]
MSKLTIPWHTIIAMIAWLALGNGIAESQQALTQTRSFQNLNPDIALDGLFAAAYFSEPENLNFGAHDPTERGFNVQNLELSLRSTVDPYFQGEGYFIFGLSRGESFLEVEELFFTSLALPLNLQLRGGQFFTRFGRLNPIHPHAWDFADQPIINGRLLGGDGLRQVGMQLSYLLPLPIYTEVIVGMQNPYGETAVSFFNTPGEDEESGEAATYLGRPLIEREIGSLADFIYLTRLNASIELTDTMTMVWGGSALFGPNASGEETRTTILGTDLYFKWRPLSTVRGWPFITWQSEVMWRNYEAGSFIHADGDMIPQEDLKDWGFYSQLLYGFRPRWVAGIRGEYATGEDSTDPMQDRRYRLSANLTFYPSEFSKWRLQYNYDVSESKDDKPIHAVFLEWEFLMGAHGAHQF